MLFQERRSLHQNWIDGGPDAHAPPIRVLRHIRADVHAGTENTFQAGQNDRRAGVRKTLK